MEQEHEICSTPHFRAQPEHCKALIDQTCLSQHDSRPLHQFIPYTTYPWLQLPVIVFLIIVYVAPILYVWSKRNFAETRARSPITTSLCILFIMLDSVFNTWIFAINVGRESHKIEAVRLKCLLGVWVTMLLMVPILVSMYLRIYRVKRVFELYEKYLDREQKRAGSCFSYNRTF